MDIMRFDKSYRFLSNFWITPFKYNGVVYDCTEKAYQAAKFTHLTPEEIANTGIINPNDLPSDLNMNDPQFIEKYFAKLKSPMDAKHLGKVFPLRPDWDTKKYNIMREIVYAKFSQNASLKKLLLNTGDATLIEGNHWHDNIWGKCDCANCKHKTQKNMLGVILMKTRSKLKGK